jgi:hypothetical protein
LVGFWKNSDSEFSQKPQEGIGCPSAPLKGDQMGWNFGCKEQCSMLLQYQLNTCHLSIRFLGKSIQRLRGNALPWQWLVLDWPLNRK